LGGTTLYCGCKKSCTGALYPINDRFSTIQSGAGFRHHPQYDWTESSKFIYGIWMDMTDFRPQKNSMVFFVLIVAIPQMGWLTDLYITWYNCQRAITAGYNEDHNWMELQPSRNGLFIVGLLTLILFLIGCAWNMDVKRGFLEMATIWSLQTLCWWKWPPFTFHGYHDYIATLQWYTSLH
jgi:hypothetical protein